jgi:hypothetical protein
MNKYLAPLIIFVALLSTTAHVLADNDTPIYTFNVNQSPEPYYIDDGPVRHRSPSIPIVCTISSIGVFIPSITSDEILLYEVYNSDGDCIGSFTSDLDFISFIYKIKGYFEIRIHIEGYVFHGYIFL